MSRQYPGRLRRLLLMSARKNLISNSDANPTGPPPIYHMSSKIPSAPLPPLLPLPPSPSPLLCPRRTFLACLRASKLMQDRSYSGKAGRSLGRCERALGEALEWRLWVGKGPSAPSTMSSLSNCALPQRTHYPVAVFLTDPHDLVPLYPAHAAAVQTCSRSLSNLRRTATMPNMEANAGDGFPCANTTTVSYEHSAATAMEATLIAEPNMDDFDFAGAPVPSMLVAPTLQVSLYADDVSSPSLSTPGLVYSPMSTSSTTSSDDGDRTAHLGFQHIPSSLGYSEISADVPGGKPFVMDYSLWAVSETIFARNKLPSLEPYIVDQPVWLPPSNLSPYLLLRGISCKVQLSR
ncbi:uncharacterized protein PHACADRAFT_33607 [Phanerochaete carnosa HHB-10118-sp]|uniref:Uncharacterized protein n=1 Tax=Phanerochaete carnosa (strain HHB-10118-sp) TaxID=650164 RepID=K5VDD3_PHACS|nr:uncharacterized protein PHACADRAFT_33607 [Phanerochaete carnosa HHB-10118-sp]EKM49143.1 hypothetical protein PHACADRAFT_33607 [Phanerochaete carnosa HHB-10118-sp]